MWQLQLLIWGLIILFRLFQVTTPSVIDSMIPDLQLYDEDSEMLVNSPDRFDQLVIAVCVPVSSLLLAL